MKAELVETALIDEKGCKKGAKTCPFAPSLVAAKLGKNSGDDETRTRDLWGDRIRKPMSGRIGTDVRTGLQNG